MGRWAPDAKGRLARTALDLYAEQGYEHTTVEQIAKAAGLTERTFFRHFADKREVLFWGSSILQQVLVDTVRDAPPSLTPMETVEAAVSALGPIFDDPAFSKKRQAIVDSNPELQERELIKRAAFSAAVAAALRERGVKEPAASLTADSGMAVFRVAFERWTTMSRPPKLERIIRDTFAELKGVTAG
jgi:AcrR family transcriptional regulator